MTRALALVALATVATVIGTGFAIGLHVRPHEREHSDVTAARRMMLNAGQAEVDRLHALLGRLEASGYARTQGDGD